VASGGAARRESPHDPEEGAPVPRTHARKKARRKSPVELDRVIHERVRLAIVSALAGAEALSFNELKDLLEITDGNLSVHARRLEEAGFVACEKSFVERMPRTEYRLTPAGRAALDDYLDHMESLIRRVREG
jgi:DNA-binding HxlR family transcriptional regulator